MRVTALVLSILGGLAGLLAVMLAAGGAALGANVQSESTGYLAGSALISLVLVVLGFVGGGLAMSKPRAAALILLITGVGLMFSSGLLGIFSWPLFLIASLMAFLGRGKKAPATAAIVPAVAAPVAATPPPPPTEPTTPPTA